MNSMIPAGKKIAAEKFEEILNITMKKLEAREKIKQNAIIISDVMIFMAQCSSNDEICVLRFLLLVTIDNILTLINQYISNYL